MHPAANQYRKHQMSTSTPAQLIGLLYDALLASIRRGAEALHDGSHALANEQLVRAQRIVTELRCSLNFEAGGEIASNLDAIYDYVWRQLVVANTRRDAAVAVQCLELVVPLRDAWAQALLGQGAAQVERIPA
jgi:flagellar protein FliS